MTSTSSSTSGSQSSIRSDIVDLFASGVAGSFAATEASESATELSSEDQCLEELKGVDKFYTKLVDKLKKDIEDCSGSAWKDTLLKRLSKVPALDKEIFNTQLNSVESIRFYGYSMIIVTNEIIIKWSPDDSPSLVFNVPVGKFKIYCRFGTQNTIFENLSAPADSPLRHLYQHPHIKRGRPCWGEYTDSIMAAYKTLDINRLITLIMSFLQHAYPGGWFTHIQEWMDHFQRKAFHDAICSSCYRTRTNCTCTDEVNESTICSGCGYEEDECECVRCPANGDRLEDNSFPDTYCLTCRHLCRNLDSGMVECRYSFNESEIAPYASHETDLEYVDLELPGKYYTMLNGVKVPNSTPEQYPEPDKQPEH